MSLLFAEAVRQNVAQLRGHDLVEADAVERCAVMAAILDLATDRLIEKYDFPENWKNDPEACGILISLVISIFVAWAPDPEDSARYLLENLDKIKNEPPVEPKTNRERVRKRKLDIIHEREWRDTRKYDPAKWGRVRQHTQSELMEFIDQAAQRAAVARRQWLSGTPLERIDG